MNVRNKQEFALGKPFQPSVMFSGKAGSGNTKGRSITVPLTSCLTRLD
jgi:hypothetical protein